jgi:peroxiredoxin
MIKKAVAIPLLIGSLTALSGTAVLARDEEVKVYSSLEEAIPCPERPVLLVFFSLECHRCWDELFEMRYFLEKNDIPVDMVGIAREPEEELRPFLAKYTFSYPVVCDRRKTLFKMFHVRLEPFCVVLDKGSVLYEDDESQDFFVRRDEVKRCLLEIAFR